MRSRYSPLLMVLVLVSAGVALAVGPLAHAQAVPPRIANLAVSQRPGTFYVAWTASEDDGFNDRDVVRYEVWRAVLPGGEWAKVEELPAGTEVYFGAAPAVDGAHFLRYGVKAVDGHNHTSELGLADRLMTNGRTVDNDGDGRPMIGSAVTGQDPRILRTPPPMPTEMA